MSFGRRYLSDFIVSFSDSGKALADTLRQTTMDQRRNAAGRNRVKDDANTVQRNCPNDWSAIHTICLLSYVSCDAIATNRDGPLLMRILGK